MKSLFLIIIIFVSGFVLVNAFGALSNSRELEKEYPIGTKVVVGNEHGVVVNHRIWGSAQLEINFTNHTALVDYKAAKIDVTRPDSIATQAKAN